MPASVSRPAGGGSTWRRRALEQERGDVAEVAAPHPPVVRALGLEECVLDTRPVEGLVQGPGPFIAASSLPHAIHSRSISVLVFTGSAASGAIGSEPGAVVEPPPPRPALMTPTWLNVWRCRSPNRPACPPPIEKPMIARCVRSAMVRYVLSIIGMMSSSRSRSYSAASPRGPSAPGGAMPVPSPLTCAPRSPAA